MQVIKSIAFAYWQKFRLRYGKKTKSILCIAFYIPKVLLGKKKIITSTHVRYLFKYFKVTI